MHGPREAATELLEHGERHLPSERVADKGVGIQSHVLQKPENVVCRALYGIRELGHFRRALHDQTSRDVRCCSPFMEGKKEEEKKKRMKKESELLRDSDGQRVGAANAGNVSSNDGRS